MVNAWFKFYGGEYLSDPKIAGLTPQERSCWITLLAIASTATTPGTIEYLTIEVLLEKSGVRPKPNSNDSNDEWKSCVTVLEKFAKMQMITKNKNGAIQIVNWCKRQETALTNAERQARYRNGKVTGRVTKVTLDQRRSDKRRERSTSTTLSSTKVGSKINGRIKKKMSKIRAYDENNPGDYTPSVDADSGELIQAPVEKNYSASYKALLEWAVNRTGRKFVNIPKQYAAMKKMRAVGISKEDIQLRWIELESQPFYEKNGMDFMTVASSFDKKQP